MTFNNTHFSKWVFPCKTTNKKTFKNTSHPV